MKHEKREKFLKITEKQIDTIYNSGKEANKKFILFLVEKINQLEEKVSRQQDEIQKSKAIISKDSHNSNKPPSSDNPFKKMKKTKSLRKKGGKAGGQKGHKGTNLKQTQNPDIIKPLKICGKCDCGSDLSQAECIGHEKRQKFDIPEIKITITEYQADVVVCNNCGNIHTAKFPEDVKRPASYGPNIKSLIVYLKHNGFLSYERLAEFLLDVIGHTISQGTLVNTINEYASKIEKDVCLIKENIIQEKVVHFDETGLRVEGSLHWLHSAGSSQFVYYFIHKNRGRIAMDEIGILPFFSGIAVHDHWDSYYLYNVCLHSL